MIQNAYTLFDRKSLLYSPPFYTLNHEIAKRMVCDVARDLNTSVGRHPTDFVLLCVGHYDDAKGALVPLHPIEHVADVVSLLPAPVPAPDLFAK